jgi:hypothetical protein
MDISSVDTSARDAAESSQGMLDSTLKRRVPQSFPVPYRLLRLRQGFVTRRRLAARDVAAPQAIPFPPENFDLDRPDFFALTFGISSAVGGYADSRRALAWLL